jgi:hypothetical protein
MHRGSTVFLRGVIVLIGAFILGLCAFVLPAGLLSDQTGYYRPILAGLYVPAVPFFYALYQSLRLLGLIDKNQAFTQASVSAFQWIKLSALTICGLFAVGMPYIFYAADMDDAPGVVAIGLIIIFASFVIATFAAVLEKLVHNAVDIKTEHDLTV